MDTRLHLPTLGATAAGPISHAARTLRTRVRHGCLALWRGLERHGRARSIRELQILDARWESIDSDRGRAVRGARDALLARHAGRP